MFLLLNSSTLEHTLAKQISCEIHIPWKWEINYFKIKIIPFIINLRRNYAKPQTKNGATISEEFV